MRRFTRLQLTTLGVIILMIFQHVSAGPVIDNQAEESTTSTTSSTVSLSQSPPDKSDKGPTQQPTIVQREVTAGETIELSCTVPDNVSDSSISWEHNDNEKDESTRVISLQKVSAENSGSYRCYTKEGKEFQLLTEFHIIVLPLNEETTDKSKAIGWVKPPRYIGIAIGLGVCLVLFLLSLAAVFILNLKDSGGCGNALECGGKKQEEPSFARLAAVGERQKVKLVPLPMSRMHSVYDK